MNALRRLTLVVAGSEISAGAVLHTSTIEGPHDAADDMRMRMSEFARDTIINLRIENM